MLQEILEQLVRMDARLDSRIEEESRLTRAAVSNNTQVTREILIELREAEVLDWTRCCVGAVAVRAKRGGRAYRSEPYR